MLHYKKRMKNINFTKLRCSERKTVKLFCLLIAVVIATVMPFTPFQNAIWSPLFVADATITRYYAGDIDLNSKIEPSDARTILRVAVQLEELEGVEKCVVLANDAAVPTKGQLADIDGDGKITPADARAVLRMAVLLDEQRSIEVEITEPAVETTTEEPAVETTTEEPAVETTTGEPAVETTTGEPAVETTTENGPTVEKINKYIAELKRDSGGLTVEQIATVEQEMRNMQANGAEWIEIREKLVANEIAHSSALENLALDKEKTVLSASGNPVVLNGTSESKFDSFSLSADKAKSVTICGKNIFKLNELSASRTENGVTFGFTNAQGKIRVYSASGATDNAKSALSYIDGNFNFTFANDTQISVSDNCSIHAQFDYPVQMRVYDSANNRYFSVGAGGLNFIAKAGVKYSIYILVRQGWAGDITFYPQVEIGNNPTLFETYDGITVGVPAGDGAEIFDSDSFGYTSPDGCVMWAYHQDVDRLYVEADGNQKSMVIVADYGNVVNIGGTDYYVITSFRGVNGAVSVTGIPEKYAGKIRLQISDGAIYRYDDGHGVLINADSAKTYFVRLIVNPGVKINDYIRISVTTGKLALLNSASHKGTTTILTDDASAISVSAVGTTMQENAEDSIAAINSINLLCGGKANSFLDKLKSNAPMISFIDDDTTSVLLVKRYHDIFTEPDKVTSTRRDNGAVGSDAVETKNVDDKSGLLDLLLRYEEEGFGMLYHCCFQQGSNTRYWIKGDPSYNKDLIRENYFAGLRKMAQYGFVNYKYWVTPYGVNDDFIVDLAKTTGMQCLFNCPSSNYEQDGFVNPSCNVSKWDIPRLTLNPETDMVKLQNITDACIAANGWMIVVTHANAWGDVDMETKLGDYIDYCIANGMKIVTPQAGFETYRAVFDLYDLT